MIIVKGWRYRLAAVVAITLGLLSVMNEAEPLAQGQPPCTLTVQPGESIQAVIDQAKPGAVICLEGAVWNENLTIAKSMTLRGVGPGRPRISGVRDGYPVINIQGEYEIEVAIENLLITEARGEKCAVKGPQGICPYGIQARGWVKVTIQNTVVSDHSMGIWVTDDAQATIISSTFSRNRWHGIAVDGFAQVVLTNTTVFDNNGDGLLVGGSAQVIISDAQVSGNSIDGFMVGDSAKVTIENSTISDNQTGLYVWNLARVSITACTISDNKEGGLIARELAAVSLTNSNFSRNGIGLKVSGSVIVNLSNSTVSQNRGYGIYAEDSTEVDIRSSKVSDNGYRGLGLWESAKVALANSTVSGNSEDGLYIAGLAKVSLTNSQVSDNGGNGLKIYNNARVTLLTSQVSLNKGHGLSVWDEAQVSLTSCQVSSNKHAGISIGESWRLGDELIKAEVTVSECEISGNEFDGLLVGGEAFVRIGNSRISHNGDGIRMWVHDYASIYDSYFSENRGRGVNVAGGASADLSSVTISGNGLDGIYAHSVTGNPATVEIKGSTIESNGLDPMCSETTRICNGIFAGHRARITISSSFIRNNTDWGVSALMERCGYKADAPWQVDLDINNVIGGNNKSGNQDGMGNPGNHPWNRPNVPDGQVCLP